MEEVLAVPAVAEPDLEARFARFAATHRERAVRLAWRILRGDRAAAEDVAQDAFVRAYRGLDRFRDEASLDTWFYRVLVRQAYSHLRWRAVRNRFGGLAGAEPEDDPPDPGAEPEGDPVLRRRIGDALAALPRTQRDAFLLVHLEGFTVKETASILGKAPGTVKSHLHRALTALRRRLEDTLDATPDAAAGEPT